MAMARCISSVLHALSILMLATSIWKGVPLHAAAPSKDDSPSRDDVAKFLDTYSDALDALESRYAHFRCAARHVRPSYEADVRYFVKEGCFQTETTYAEQKDRRPPNYPRVHVRSECGDRVFEISKQTLDGPFMIAGFGDLIQQQLERYHLRYCRPIAQAPTHIFGMSMRAIIGDPATRISAISQVEDGDHRLVEVAFELNRDTFKFHRATVRFLPEEEWIVKGYDLLYEGQYTTGVSTATYSGQVEYATPAGATYPFPSRVRIEVRQPPNDPVLVEDATTREVVFDRISDKQFTLAHFGLPELGNEREDGHFVIWLALGSTVVFAGCLVYLLKSRATK